MDEPAAKDEIKELALPSTGALLSILGTILGVPGYTHASAAAGVATTGVGSGIGLNPPGYTTRRSYRQRSKGMLWS